ncbi:MAG: DUF1934 domain-containing protein [Pseudobutyrivibrio sp.]|nr:DUF1934 domain-containing protein [Pseudobutyrivibrio sp.]
MAGTKCHIVINSAQMIDFSMESIREEYQANYLVRDGKHYFSYEKKDEEGNVINVLIVMSEDAMTMKQSGHINSMMIFKKGEVFHNRYSTPFGDFDMATDTTDYELKVTDTRVSLRATYLLNISGGEPVKTTISIETTQL